MTKQEIIKKWTEKCEIFTSVWILEPEKYRRGYIDCLGEMLEDVKHLDREDIWERRRWNVVERLVGEGWQADKAIQMANQVILMYRKEIKDKIIEK